MTTDRKKNLAHVLAAAIALAVPSVALAQGQIDAGRSNDASNRVGSGGRNQAGFGSNYGQQNYIINNGNRIVTGNVSMGREFRGNVGYTDPTAFRGRTAGIVSDNFARNSAGVPRGNAPEPVPNSSVPFYGAAQTVAPPPGFQLNASRTGFVPPPPAAGRRSIQDQRLGVLNVDSPMLNTPAPGDMMMRGSLNPQQAAQQFGVLTGSTLYGVREWNPQDPADRAFLENLVARQNGLNRLQSDPREVQRMRDELEKSLDIQQQQQPLGADAQQQPRPVDALNINPLGQTFDSPASAQVTNRPIGDQLQSRTVGGTGVGTDQGMRFNVLGGARRSSTQYAELNKRLEQYYGERRTAEAEVRKFNDELRARNEADAAANKGKRPDLAGGTDPTKPTAPGKEPAAPDKPKVKKPQPVKITALSTGVRAEGLGNLMKQAEGLMKQGKYASALDQYDAAEAVAPRDPMIWLGRANAELGAGFYGRADTHLQQAFTSDKALLMAQFDLANMIGDERLTKVVAELKDMASKDEKNPTPVFLLAYVAYNTAHERQAFGYLDLAEKRAATPQQAAFYNTLKEHWAVPDEDAAKPQGTGDVGATPAPGTELRKPELNK
jgi:tetratricopeptide (TPR) repeat protein